MEKHGYIILSYRQNKGIILPYCLLMMVVMMLMVYSLINLFRQELRASEAKAGYYQLLLLEDQAIEHVKAQLRINDLETRFNERIWHQDGYIYYEYFGDGQRMNYLVTITITYQNYRYQFSINYNTMTQEYTYIMG